MQNLDDDRVRNIVSEHIEGLKPNEKFKKDAASIGLTARASGCSWKVLEEMIEEALAEAYAEGLKRGVT